MFEKYDASKDSGVEWLGQLPENWDLLPNKHIFKLKKNLVGKRSKEYELLSLTLNGVIKRDMENPEGKFPAEFDTYQEVTSGDFIFCHFDVEETPRTVGLSRFDGMITGAYTVYKVNAEKFCPEFLYYFYLNLDTGKRLKPLYKGLRNTIGKDIFGEFKTFIPNYSEQVKISNFLDQKVTEIDQAIAIKEQQIALLNERKQIVIQKAVTQGLDPNVPMKDSGVEWIGQIPEDWEIRANRTIFKERNEQGKEGLPLLSVSIHSGVSNEEIAEEDNVRGRIKIEDKSKYILVKKGDVAFNMMRAWQGGIGAVSVDGMVSPAYIVAKPNHLINSEFFEYQYRCPEFIQQMDRYSKGITDFRKRLYWDGFKQLLTVVPPIDEQLKIVEQIKAIEQQTNVATQIKNQQIEKLKEYKTTLINDAVTGKIKVA